MHEGWIAAIFTGVALVIGASVAAWNNLKTSKSSIQLKEQDETIRRMNSHMDRLDQRIEELEKDVHECHKERATFQVENAALKKTVEFLERDIRQLQRETGIAGGGAISATFTAGIDGTIINVGPGVSQLLKYLPTELVGKSVDLLIPDRYLASHKQAMEQMQKEDRPPDLDRVIIGFAKDRDGAEVPVSIRLFGWKDESSRWVVTAEMTKRMPRPTKAVRGTRASDGTDQHTPLSDTEKRG